MREFTVENQGSNVYLVYRISGDETLDSMDLGMITNNDIPGFAKTIYMQMNMEKMLKYDITAKITLKQFFANEVNRAGFLSVFKSISEMLVQAEEYMIDIPFIDFNLEHIYVNLTDKSVAFVCLPVNEKKEDIDMVGFFRNIVMSSRFDSSENGDYVMKLMNYLNSCISFSAPEFDEFIGKLIAQKAPVQKPAVNNTAAKPVEAAPSKPQLQQDLPAQAVEEVKNQAVRIPDVAVTPTVVEVTPNDVGETERMSMFYLLQHYNKENKAIYDAQKKAKKNGAAKVEEKKVKEKPSKNTSGMAIPGMAVPGMAIPGMNVSNNQNAVEKEEPAAQSSKKVENKPIGNPKAVVKQNVSYSSASSKLDFGETVMMYNSNDSEATINIQEEKLIVPRLIRMKNNEEIIINKAEFKLGRDASYADYCISDNPAVGRSHANIIRKDEQYYLVDQNSRNHTYLNGEMLSSGASYALNDGDAVKLANEAFTFRL